MTVKKGADEGKSKWGGKSELPSRLWSELSSTGRAHRAQLSTFASSYPPESPKLRIYSEEFGTFQGKMVNKTRN